MSRNRPIFQWPLKRRTAGVKRQPRRLTAIVVSASLVLGAASSVAMAQPSRPEGKGSGVSGPHQRTGTATGKAHKVPTAATRKAPEHIGPKAKTAVPGKDQVPAAVAKYQSQADLLKKTVDVAGTKSVAKPLPDKAPRAKGQFDVATSVELPAKRTATTDTYKNADGTYTLKASAGRLNYQKQDGSWAALDETLVPTGNGWTQRADSQKSIFAPTGTSSQLMSLSDGKNRIGFGLVGASDVTGVVSGDEVTYAGIVKDADLRLYSTTIGIKEEMVLHGPAAQTVWTFPLSLSAGLSASIDGGGDLVATDASRNVVFRVPAGFMTDSKLDAATGEGAKSTNISYTVVSTGGGQALQVTLDAAWLHDAARVFPVIVDPTTGVQIKAIYTAAYNAAGNPTFKWDGYGGETAVGSPYGSQGSANTSMMIVPPVAGTTTGPGALLPAQADVINASIWMYPTWAANCSATPVYVMPITSYWPPSSGNYHYPQHGPVIASGTVSGGRNCSSAVYNMIDMGSSSAALAELNTWTHDFSTNHGLLLVTDNTNAGDYKRFASAANSLNYPPYLNLTYSADNFDVSYSTLQADGSLRWSTQPMANQGGQLPVTLINNGQSTWSGADGLGYHIYADPGRDTIEVAHGLAATLPGDVPAYQHPAASVTVTAALPVVPVGNYDVCWDMLATDHTTFWSTWGVTMHCTSLDVSHVGPTLTGTSPGDGYSVDTLMPTLTASWYEGDGTNPGTVSYAWQVCPTDGSGAAACPSQNSIATSDRFLVVSTLSGTSTPLVWGQTYAWRVTITDGSGSSVQSAWTSFVPEIPQPAVTSHIGGGTDSASGHSVDPQVGNYVLPVTDAQVATYGPALAMARTYNSLDPRPALSFGAGWASMVDSSAAALNLENNDVVVTYPDGQQVRFGANADGTYTAPAGRSATLTTISGGGYTLADTSGAKYTFSTVSAGSFVTTYKLSKIADGQGRTETFVWTDSTHMTITAANGRHLYLTFTTPSGATAPHVSTVSTDPTAGAGTSLTWTYSYTGDQLSAVCPPTSTTACTGYSYQAAGSHYRSTVLDSNPAAYWRLGDVSAGTGAHDEVTVNAGVDNGSYGGGVSAGTSGPLPAGTGGSAVLDGSSGFIAAPNGMVQGRTYLAVSMWFKTTSSSAGMLFSTGHSLGGTPNPSGAAMPVLYVGTDGLLHGHFWDGTVAGMASSARVNDGNWHQVVLSAQGTVQDLYLDGRLQTQSSGNPLTNIDPIDLVGTGVFNSNGWPAAPGGNTWGYFNGSLSEVSFYDHPVSGYTVAQAYNAVAAPLLNKITTPMGKTGTQITYTMTTGRVSQLTDANGGTWNYGLPQAAGQSASYKSAVMATSPVAYWPLTEAGAGPATNLINSQKAFYNNITQASPNVFGDGNAAVFDGTSSYVATTGTKPVLDTSASFTTSAWVELSATPGTGNYEVLSQDGNTASSFMFGYLHSCSCWWAYQPGSDSVNVGGPTLQSPDNTAQIGRWTHLALAYDATAQTMTFYVNGASVGSANTVGWTSSGAFTIGRAKYNGNAVDYFPGVISDVAVSRQALSAKAVATLYQSYDPAGAGKQVTATVTDPGGNAIVYTYDPTRGGRELSVSDGTGGVTTYGYDAAGFLNTVTDPNGDIVTTGHDKYGNAVSTTTCKDMAGADCATSYANYAQAGGSGGPWVVTDTRDARSTGPTDTRYVTKRVYNGTGAALGEIVSLTTPATPDFPNGRTTLTSYTAGTEAAVCPLGIATCPGTQPAGMVAKTVDPAGLTTLFAYDATGELTKQTDPSGLVTVYGYDNIGRDTGARQYSDTFPAGVETDVVLDGQSRKIQVTGPVTTDKVTAAVHQQQTTTAYDDDGNVSSVTVADTKGADAARKTSYTYDASNRVRTATDPTGAVTTYGYDGYGHRTSVIDAMKVETDYSYDADGRLLTTSLHNWTGDPTSPSAATDLMLESRAYDPAGRLASVTDAMGRETAYQYYDDNRLYQTAVDNFHNPDGTVRKIVEQDNWYDGAGNVYKTTAGDTIRETDNTFDAAGRMTASTYDKTGINRVTNYAYDADDNILSTTVTGAGSAALPVAGGPAYVARTTSATSATGGSSIAMGVSTPTKAGDALLVSMMLTNSATGPVTVSDSAGNTYTPVVDKPDGNKDRTLIFAALSAKAMPTGTITVHTPATGEYHVAVDEFSGVTAVDQTAAATSTAGPPWNTGSTPTTTQATELLFAAAGIQGGSPTVWGSGFTALPTLFVSTDQLATGYRTVTSTGSYSASGTANHQWMAGIVTLKGAAGNGGVAIGKPVTFAGATQTTTRAYDAAERLKSQSVTTAAGIATTSFGYDQRGLVTSTTDPRGNGNNGAYTSTAAFNELGQQVSVTGPAVKAESNGGAAVTVNPTTLIGYNTFGERTETKDADGNVSGATYDLDGRPLTRSAPVYVPPGSTTAVTPTVTTHYDAAGRVTSQTDALNNTITFVLDQRGRTWAKTDPPINGNTAGGTTHYILDDDSELIAVTDPTGAVTQATYDDLGRKITTTDIVRTPAAAAHTSTMVYDDASNLTGSTSAAGVPSTMTYDMAGDVLTTKDAAGNLSKYQYDLDGHVVKGTDPMGLSTVTVYDGAGQLTATADLDAQGNVLRADSTGYDLAGNKTSATDYLGNTTTFTLDAAARLTQQVEPVSAGHSITTTYGYDAAGNRTRFTDGNGNAVITGYNSLGLAETITEPATTAYPNAADRTWTTSYDADGHPVTVTEPGNVVRTRTYDALGDVTKETGSGAEAGTADHTYSYDLAGRLTGVAAPGTADTFTYDDRGLLLSTAGASGTSAFGYDADARVTTRTDAAGTATYGYDTSGRLSATTDPVTGTNISYGYNADSQISTQTFGTGGNIRTFGYDNLGRRSSDTLATNAKVTIASVLYGHNDDDQTTGKTSTGFAGAAANTYGYDQAGRLTSWNNGTATVAYSYDDAGNRTGIGTRALTYDARNRLTGDGTNSYTYSARGTRTGKTSSGITVTSTFDAFDRMTADGSTTYTYDGLDRMITAGGSTLVYTGEGNDIAGDGTTTYSRGPAGGVLALGQGAAKALAWTDQHTDLVATFTAGGTTLAGSTTFDPLGTPLAAAGTKSKLGYQSGWTDATTGKTNMAARWYDPGTGQFTSRDTWSLSPNPVSGDANRYGYATGDPIGGTDPSGHDGCGARKLGPFAFVEETILPIWIVCASFTSDKISGEDPGAAACANVGPSDPMAGTCVEYGYGTWGDSGTDSGGDWSGGDWGGSSDNVCSDLTPGTKEYHYYGCGAPPTPQPAPPKQPHPKPKPPSVCVTCLYLVTTPLPPRAPLPPKPPTIPGPGSPKQEHDDHRTTEDPLPPRPYQVADERGQGRQTSDCGSDIVDCLQRMLSPNPTQIQVQVTPEDCRRLPAGQPQLACLMALNNLLYANLYRDAPPVFGAGDEACPTQSPRGINGNIYLPLQRFAPGNDNGKDGGRPNCRATGAWMRSNMAMNGSPAFERPRPAGYDNTGCPDGPNNSHLLGNNSMGGSGLNLRNLVPLCRRTNSPAMSSQLEEPVRQALQNTGVPNDVEVLSVPVWGIPGYRPGVPGGIDYITVINGVHRDCFLQNDGYQTPQAVCRP